LLNPKSSVRLLSVLLTAMALSACSSEPSESEMGTALEAQFKIDAPVMKLTGIEYKSMKKIGCKEDGEKAFRCDVELKMGVAGADKMSPAKMRFVKTSEGWRVTK
jgi:hypothetical protein